MKQVGQRPKDGLLSVVDVPPPVVRQGWVVVESAFSLISAGTERTKVETGEKNLLQKARARPDLVKKVSTAPASRALALRSVSRVTGSPRSRHSATRPRALCSRSGQESKGSPPATGSPAAAGLGEPR